PDAGALSLDTWFVGALARVRRQWRLFARAVHVVPNMAAGSLPNPDPGNRGQLLLQCTAIHRVPRTAGRRGAHHLLRRLRQGRSHREHDLYPWPGRRPILSRNPRQNVARLENRRRTVTFRNPWI